MIKSIYLLIFTSLMSCGPIEDYLNKPHKKQVKIYTPDLQYYVNKFIKDGKKLGHNIVIDDLIMGFGTFYNENEEKDSSTLGMCYRGTNTTPRVTISIDHWPTLSPHEKEILVYHELGHCILKRNHVDEDERLSIMEAFILNDAFYGHNKEQLLNELFDTRYRNTWILLHDLFIDVSCTYGE